MSKHKILFILVLDLYLLFILFGACVSKLYGDLVTLYFMLILVRLLLLIAV